MKINVQGVRVDSLPFDAPAWYFCYEYAADGKTVIGLRCGCPYPSFWNETLREGKYHWHGFLRAGSFEEC